MPGMTVMSPKDANELRQMLYSAYVYDKPVAIRYPRGEAQLLKGIQKKFQEIPLGTWEKLREGGDITIIACGNLVYPSLTAADELEGEGIYCSVINGRFIKPMDRAMLVEAAGRTKYILTVEENAAIGGFGSGVMEVLSEEGVTVPVKMLGIPDFFLPHGSQKTLRATTGLDSEGIKKAVREWLKSE
jgi:1-deoxy-D-xylulose-5-phosphate synthase